MNNQPKPDYSLSQFYTDNEIETFQKLVLITKIHKHAMDLYGKIYPHNNDAKKDDKLLMAIFTRIMGNLHSSIKCNITYDECYGKLIVTGMVILVILGIMFGVVLLVGTRIIFYCKGLMRVLLREFPNM